MRRTIGKRLLESTQQLPHFYATAEINMGEYKISAARYPKDIEEWESGMKKGNADLTDRLLKLREIFNKASEGKTKLSVNDFSTYTFLLPPLSFFSIHQMSHS